MPIDQKLIEQIKKGEIKEILSLENKGIKDDDLKELFSAIEVGGRYIKTVDLTSNSTSAFNSAPPIVIKKILRSPITLPGIAILNTCFISIYHFYKKVGFAKEPLELRGYSRKFREGSVLCISAINQYLKKKKIAKELIIDSGKEGLSIETDQIKAFYDHVVSTDWLKKFLDAFSELAQPTSSEAKSELIIEPLKANFITDAGVEVILQYLPKTRICNLFLRGNEISDSNLSRITSVVFENGQKYSGISGAISDLLEGMSAVQEKLRTQYGFEDPKVTKEKAEQSRKEQELKAQQEAAEKLRQEQELKKRQEAEEKRRQEEKQKQLQELHKKGEQGDITAQLDLASRYETGNGVAKDPQQVLYWYEKAAEQGNDIAQQKLGEIFEKGLAGKKDYAQAYSWYQKAADQGNDPACAGLRSLKEKGYRPRPSAEFKASPAPDKSPVGSTHPVTKETRTEAKDDMSSAVSFEINYDQLTFGKELGRGGFGIVYQGTWRFNNVAIKQLLTKSLSAEALEEFNAESRIMAQLRSEYVVQFYGRCVTPTYCLVMQNMPKGSLFNLLRSSETLDWSVRNRMITEIASGLAFLHASNIFHRDLKSLNVLLDEHYRTKLCDFGLSKVKKENQSTSTMGGPVGTLAWMAPELFERRATFTAKADIYSLAMTLWEIASRKIPFADASSPSLIPMWVVQGQREEIPSDTPIKISSLIRCCWHQDPTKRPSAAEVVTYLRSDQAEFKSTETAPSSSATTSIPGNLVSSAGSDLGSLSIRANLMSGSMG